MRRNNQVIVISRTDSIGDVVLTLPMAGLIRKHLPAARIIFLGRSYTAPVVALSEYVDTFLNWDEISVSADPAAAFRSSGADTFIHVLPSRIIARIAKRAGIPTRVGTKNRVFHWLTCNRLVRLSRKRSDLHESQLNFSLLECLGIDPWVPLSEMHRYYGFRMPSPPDAFQDVLLPAGPKIILHPKSRGSAQEWGVANFNELAHQLTDAGCKVFVCGTKEEGELIAGSFSAPVINLCGRMTLNEYISFISACDGLVAASTGPLHIAAALGRIAIGLFSPRRPIHPGRWQPVGPRAHALVYDPACEKCAAGMPCTCIEKIPPQNVLNLLLSELPR